MSFRLVKFLKSKPSSSLLTKSFTPVPNNSQNRKYSRQTPSSFKTLVNGLQGANPHTPYTVAAVFGATGFIGKYVVHELAQAGYQIIVPYRGNDFVTQEHKVMGDIGQVVSMKWDGSRYESILDICSRANVVVNCAGRTYPTQFDDSWEFSNVTLAEKIAKACKETYVDRVVHVSALGADIEHPSKYLRMKAMAELKVKEYLPEATIIRPAHIYGSIDRFINFIARRLSPMNPFGVPVVRNGQAKIQPVFVGNVADGIVAILALADTEGLTFEFGGPKVYKWNELIKFVADGIGQQYNVTSMPAPIAKGVGMVLQTIMTRPLFTSDFVNQMEYDCVVNENTNVFTDLGIEPLPMEEAATDVLRKFAKAPSFHIKNTFEYV